jgi:hypothetical protein
MNYPLMKYETAKTALAAACKVDEVKMIHDKAHAMVAYAKQAKDMDLIWWATEIRSHAQRRMGEPMKAMPKAVGTVGSKIIGNKKVPLKDSTPTLVSLGISKKQSSEWQKLAAIPESTFEQILTKLKSNEKPITTQTVLTAAHNGDASKKSDVGPDLADDVTKTLLKLLARWPDAKRPTIVSMLRTQLTNIEKGKL